jgi:hypothetical protein
MQKGIAANFAKCWQKYMADGEVKDFLARSSTLFPSQTYSLQYITIAKQVLLDESKASERTSEMIPAAERIKVAQRCLTAMRGLWCNKEAITAVRALTTACAEMAESSGQRLSVEEEVGSGV